MTENERRLLIEQGRLLERIGIALESESGAIDTKSVQDMVEGIEDDVLRLLHHLERTSVELDRAHGELRAMKELLSGKTMYDARQAALIEVAEWAQAEAEKRPEDSAVLYSVAAHCWSLHSHAAGNAARAD